MWYNLWYYSYTPVCVPKNINFKIFNSMSRLNETRLLVQHESCECKFEFNKSVFNLKQKWNYDECWMTMWV